MKWLHLLLLSVAIGSGCSSKPQGSGTNTNWLRDCESSHECGASGVCQCGLCTLTCSSDDECGAGQCGSSLASALQCEAPGAARICLPAPVTDGACTEGAVPADTDFSASLSSSCNQPSALACEGFDGPLPAEYSTWYSGSMKSVLQDCRVRQGAGAIRYSTDANGSGYVQTHIGLASTVRTGPLYARFYAYVPSPVRISDYLVMFEYWQQPGSSEGKISVELKPNDALEVFVTPNDSAHLSSSEAFPRDQWNCIELGLDVATSGGSMWLAVNGTRVVEQSDLVTSAADGISVAVIEALPAEQDGAQLDLSLDELVVATAPIGCE